MSYFSLHNHTDFSNLRMLDSTNRVNTLIDYAHELGLLGVAVTDHETLSGHVRAKKHLAKRKKENPEDESWQNFKLILGNEIYLCRNDLSETNFKKDEDQFYHFILLALDEVGHKQLREISTRAFQHSWFRNMRRVPTYYRDIEEIIGANPGHIHASSACFTKGHQVRTLNGEKPIETITSEDYVLTHTGEYQRVNFPTSRDYNGIGYNITFTKDYHPITCTEDHKFLVLDKRGKTKTNWIPAKHLEKNDWCLEPLEKITYSYNYTLDQQKEMLHLKKEYDNKYANNTVPIVEQIHLTPEIIVIEGQRYRIRKVKNKEEILLNEKVYCLNVKNHSFVCEGVIVHNCLGGQIPQYILRDDLENTIKMEQFVDWCIKVFDGNFSLELQPSHQKEQIFVNRELIKLSKQKQIPYIITTDSHYLSKKERPIHKAFLNSRNAEREVDSFYSTTYLMNKEEIHSYMDKYLTSEEIETGLDATIDIGSKVKDYDLSKKVKLPYLPDKILEPTSEMRESVVNNGMPNLLKFVDSEEQSDRQLAYKIIKYCDANKNDADLVRIEDELNSILLSDEKMDQKWSKYLLQVADYTKLYWDEGDSLVGPGRGSGAGFYLNFILGITQIDPTKEKVPVYSWRFLNPERASVLD